VTPGRRAVLGSLLAALAALPAGAEEPWPVRFGGPFTLVDHKGHPRGDSDFRGSWLLIQFGYTYCPDQCPLGLSTMAEAMDALGAEAARVQPLFVTIDPGRDTPPVLARFVPQFHPRLIGLTGDERSIAAVAKAYRVHRRKVLADPAAPEHYLIDHSSFTYLVGPDGHFVTLFPYGTAPAAMAVRIVDYLRA
jgi:protein SCO1